VQPGKTGRPRIADLEADVLAAHDDGDRETLAFALRRITDRLRRAEGDVARLRLERGQWRGSEDEREASEQAQAIIESYNLKTDALALKLVLADQRREVEVRKLKRRTKHAQFRKDGTLHPAYDKYLTLLRESIIDGVSILDRVARVQELRRKNEELDDQREVTVRIIREPSEANHTEPTHVELLKESLEANANANVNSDTNGDETTT